MSTYHDFQDVKRRKPIKHWHEAIMSDLIAFPLDSGKVRAKRLGYSESYLNVIINSDMFKARFAQRRADFQARLDHSLVHKTAEAAGEALDLLLETMKKKRTEIPFDKLADFADKSLARLGYGNAGKGPAVNVMVDNRQVSVTQEELASARNALRAVEGNRAKEIQRPSSPAIQPDPITESEVV